MTFLETGERRRHGMKMGTPKDDYEERMRKARDRINQTPKAGKKKLDPATSKEPVELFVPYATMFKLEPYKGHASGRQLICLSCGQILEWRIYSIAPNKFDEECPSCKVTAPRWWKGKIHRKLELTEGNEDAKE
jgi:hypothetical protein